MKLCLEIEYRNSFFFLDTVLYKFSLPTSYRQSAEDQITKLVLVLVLVLVDR